MRSSAARLTRTLHPLPSLLWSSPLLAQAPVHYVQEYLPSVDTWVQKAPIALARVRAGAAHTNGGLYVFGGVLRCTAASAGGACAER